MASRTKKESVQLSLSIDGKPAEDTLKKLDEQNEALVRQLFDLEAAGKQSTEQYRKLKEEQQSVIKQSNEMYNAAKQAAERQAKFAVNENKSLKELNAEYRQLRAIVSNLPEDHRDFNQQVELLHKKKAKIDEMRKLFRGVKEEVQAAKNETEGMGGNMLGLDDLLKGGAIIGGVAAIGDAALDAAGDIYEDVEAMRQLRNEVELLTDASGEALDRLTVKIAALTDTFDLEQRELLTSANTLAREFGITQEEALERIEQGLLAGANLNGNFLDTIGEYSTQFAAAGSSAEEFIAVSTRASKEGIYSDKGVDVVKEFGLRIREQTTATVDALDAAFGAEFTKRITDGINSGKLTTLDALREVSAEMNNAEVPANRLQTVIADVFGGAGEDAGLRYIQSLQDIQGNMSELIDETDGYVQQQRTLQAANESLAAAQNDLAREFGGAGNALEVAKAKGQEFLIRFVIAFIEAFRPLVDGIKAFLQPFKELLSQFDIFKNQGGAVKLIVDGLTFGMRAFGQVMGFVLNMWANIITKGREFIADSPILTRAVDFITRPFRILVQIVNNFPAVLDGMVAASRQAVENVQDYFAGLIIDAEIAYLKIKSLNPFSDENVEDQIAQLQSARRQLSDEYRSIGEAFAEAYSAGVAEAKARNAEQASVVAPPSSPTSPDAPTGGSGSTGTGSGSGDPVAAIEEQGQRELQALEALELQKLDIKSRTVDQVGEQYLREQELHRRAQEAIRAQAEETARQKAAAEATAVGVAKDSLATTISLLEADEEARRKNVKAIKSFKTAQVFTNLFEEISAIWKNANSSPANILFPGAGTALAIVQTAAASARAQLAASNIQSQKYERGGIANGASHAQGGIKLWDSQSGRVVGEMEGGEPYMILSKGTYRNNRGIVDALLHSSMYRGGAPIFQTGGIFQSQVSNNQANLNQSTARLEQLQAAMLSESMAMRQAIEAIPTTLRAEVPVQTINKSNETLGDVRRAASY